MKALNHQWWLVHKQDSVPPCTIRKTQGYSPISDQSTDNGDCLLDIFRVLVYIGV